MLPGPAVIYPLDPEPHETEEFCAYDIVAVKVNLLVNSVD